MFYNAKEDDLKIRQISTGHLLKTCLLRSTTICEVLNCQPGDILEYDPTAVDKDTADQE